jgi:hypothetical protein
MAECRQMTDLISRYVDGELTEPERRELVRHLEQCPACRSVLSAYKNIAAAAAESLAEPPADFPDNVMAAIKKLPDGNIARMPVRGKTTRNAIITFAAAAACLALVLIAAPLLGGRSSSSKDAAMSEPAAAPAADNEWTSKESALDGGTLGSEMTADSYSAAGGAASDENSAGSAPADQAPMICATDTADARGETSPLPSPDQPADMRSDSELLKKYSAVFYFDGQLPEILEGMDSTQTEDGTLRIEIPAETAGTLLTDGYAGIPGNPNAGTALVVFMPPEG